MERPFLAQSGLLYEVGGWRRDVKYWGSQSPPIQIVEEELGFKKINKEILKMNDN